MKKKLAITQLCGLFVAAILPLVDGMFEWITYNRFANISKTDMSLDNLMTVQRIGGGPILYYLFYIALIATAVYCIAQLFVEHRLWSNKAMVVLPGASLLLTVIMLVACDKYTDTFKWNGELRNVAVTWGILAYVQLAVLGAVVLIECYKQFKCNE